MNRTKKSELNLTYQDFMQIGLGQKNSTRLKQIVAPDIMGYGTAVDEKIFAYAGTQQLLKEQKRQSRGLQLSWKSKQVYRHIAADENAAVFADDLYLQVKAGKETVKMYLRFTVVLEYIHNKWLVVHWHGSKPENVKSNEDTWGVESWKKKAENLEKIVRARTQDLVVKNRELEIESSLERVRAVAMGMQRPEDMLHICGILSKELGKLGIREIRNVQTAIFYPDRGTYMNYEFYEKHNKTFITDVDYKSHRVQLSFARKMMKGRGQSVVEQFKGKQLKDWYDYQKTTNQFADKYLLTAASLNYYWYSLGPVALGISTYDALTQKELDLFQRFLKVFELAYRRYLDIEKAEAQAREAQIEAALERIRARALAMHRSDELLEVAKVMREQLDLLGQPELETAAIQFYHQDPDHIVSLRAFRISSNKKDNITYNRMLIPRGSCAYVREMEKRFKGKEQQYTLKLEGAVQREWYKILFRLAPEIGPAMRKSGNERAIRYYHFSKFRGGALLLVSAVEPSAASIDLQRRAAAVFDLAYRRFEDLEQAEAQARESQIEASIERVRGAAMAMRNSVEIRTVINLVYRELTQLDTKLDRCFFMIVNPENNGITWWMGGPEGLLSENGFFVQNNPYPSHQLYLRHSRNRTRKWSYLFEGKEKRDWDRFGFGKTELSKLPEPVKNYMSGVKRVFLHGSSDRFGSLVTGSLEPLPGEQHDIISRFAGVFSQTYTRFLDLQKAEAQAREAKKEASLEKVRARSMAMQQPEELIEVAEMLRQEMGYLGVEELETSSIYLVDNESKQAECWYAIKDVRGKDTKLVRDEMSLQLTDTWVGKEMWKFFRSEKEQVSIVMKGDRRKEWINYCAERSKVLQGYYGNTIPERTYHLVKFNGGYMGAATPGAISPESVDLLKRVAAVFSLAYTRFRDLRDAAARTREAQIELALERVRARTMAMHRSDELKEVIRVVLEQFPHLNMLVEHAGFYIDYKANDDMHIWLADPNIEPFFAILPYFDSPTWNSFLAAKSTGKSFYTDLLDFDAKNKFYKSLFKLFTVPEEAQQFYLECKGLAVSTVLLENVGLYIENFSAIPYSEEENEILMRLGKVFQQTYTRFLDLQKAEAQTREAQIEAALERVRARAMAMQKSTELKEAATLLYKELMALRIGDMFNCGYVLVDEKNSLQHAWMTHADGRIRESHNMPLKGDPTMNERYAKWKKKTKLFAQQLRGTALKKHLSFVARSESPKAAKKKNSPQLPDPVFFYCGNFPDGYLHVITGKALSQEAEGILTRFTGVFEQTYTRFLDLQKAEAQAREANIEAALERVRSRSLAMHSSGELGDVVTVVLNNLMELGYIIEQGSAAHLVIFSEGTKDFVQWSADPALPHPVRSFIPYTDLPILTEFWEARQKGHDFFARVYPFEEKNTWFKFAFEHSDLKHIPGELKKLLLESETYAHSIAIEKNSAIIINSITGNQLSENQVDILRRFSKVFEQAYVRFLDLQKAEAQAREAQIEAALERVRAKVTAMQESSELLGIVVSMRHEFVSLGHQADYFWYMRWLPEKYEKAMTSGDGTRIGMVMTLPRHIHGEIRKVADWEKGNEPALVFPMDVDTAVAYVDKMIRLGDFQQVDPQAPTLDDIRHIGGLTFVMARTSQGEIGYSLTGVVPDPPAEDVATLVRFAGVFDLAYRRFEDLKEAERRNRETQIELALERVRARTMAMQKSTELFDAANVMFQQIEALGTVSWNCGFNIWEADRKFATSWNGAKGGVMVDFRTNSAEDVFKRFYEAAERGETFYVEELDREACAAHYRYMTTIPKVGELFEDMAKAGVSLPEQQIFHIAYFSHGYLMFITYEPVPHLWDIFQRFARVFEQTYTRFLDLQKAEAQARESEIQLALERVRARSLAMHQTSELQEVVNEVAQQLLQMKIDMDGGLFIVINDEVEKNVPIWAAAGAADYVSKSTVPYLERPIYTRMLAAIRKREPFLTERFSMEEKNEFLQHLFRYPPWSETPEKRKQELLARAGGYCRSVAISRHTSIGMTNHHGKAFSEEENAILRRFGNVLEQSYTRFLDLQKAEAQAREAKIESALERVRSRSLAMHHSSELSSVVDTLLREFTALEFTLTFCIINLIDEKDRSNTVWAANPETGKDPESYYMKFEDYPFHHAMWDAWKEQKKSFIYTLEGEEKRMYDEYLFTQTEFRRFPKHVQEANKALKRYVAGFTFFKYSGLQTVSENQITEDELKILERFGRVFEQSYTRFLDLQKAEQQAREAQIEASLERVRARSMAMHSSTELSDVASVMFDQMKGLGSELFAFGIVLCDKHEHAVEQWHSLGEGGMLTPFHVPIDLDYIHRYRYDQWKTGAETFSIEIPSDYIARHFELMFELPSVRIVMDDLASKGVAVTPPSWEIDYGASFRNGYLLVSSLKPFAEEKIFARFARVFEQAYTRFLDLQRAEAQARESEIQLALERVRARSLAMHKSEELAELSLELVRQVQALGVATWFCAFNIYDEDPDSSLEWGSNGQGVFSKYRTPREGVFLRYYEAGKRGETLLVNAIGEDECPAHYEYLCSLPGVGDQLLQMKAAGLPFPKSQIDHVAFFNHGYLLFITFEPVPETHDIFRRFAKVFEQSYTRFLDLKRAEAQAWEGQIELALERVRARTMAMQKSEELLEAGEILCHEMNRLGIESLTSGYVLIDEATKIGWNYTPHPGTGKIMPEAVGIPHDETAPMQRTLASWQQQEPVCVIELNEEETVAHQTFIAERSINFPLSAAELLAISPARLVLHNFNFQQGYLLIVGGKRLTDEQLTIMLRFTRVFQQTYTRFLDLKTAEAQAREAQIEAALERVRSKTMAMHSSQDLLQVTNTLSAELKNLHIARDAVSFLTEQTEQGYYMWLCSPEDNLLTKFYIPRINDKVTQLYKEAVAAGKDFYTYILTQEEKNIYIRNFFGNTAMKIYPEKERQLLYDSPGMAAAIVLLENITLSVSNFSAVPYTDPEISIIRRFAFVFQQSYTRFLDLKKAEEQARESQIEAALERVRSRTLAMQKSDELADTSAELFRQLIGLGISPNRLYITIIKDNGPEAEWWITDEDGSKLSLAYQANLNEVPAFVSMLEGWKTQQESRVIAMEGEELQAYFRYLISKDVPFRGGLEQTRRVQHLAYFSKGFIGMASPEEQPKETVELLKRFASVFNLTYTRFNDLQLAEAAARQAEQDLIEIRNAREKAEAALSELQATQKQLVQSEKMASLGELTAGIAHEIQNPLNFVNNFSEVSKELLDEMKEELEKGDVDLAKEIMEDVIQNLEKINHHGKRADGIVKGMLQHSRSSSGQKEPTDINALCDEYLRLAYHGLRAKDKSFNAKFETELEPAVGMVSVMPQEMGRVILNLINNAFYAVSERKKNEEPGYEPCVTVITRKTEDKVEIKIQDNGTGIPQKVVDKIFQPFFTTKPTGEGTGLGLSLSYDIIKAHGGALKVETKENEGSLFTIQIPTA